MPNINEDHPDTYWLEVSDLTIFQAAFWMQLNSDPRAHEHRCLCDADFANNFDDHPGGIDAVHDKCLVLESLTRTGEIKTTTEIYYGNQKLDLDLTRINKSDWLKWCCGNGYSELAASFISTSNAPQQNPAEEMEAVLGTSQSGDNNKPNSTAKLVYWRATLYSKIKQIDVNKKASVREIIKYLRRLGDSRLPDKGGHDELFWIDDNETEQRVQKKAVSNAASTARKPH